MYRCVCTDMNHKECWTPKNWCFQMWCWKRLLRVPWTARRSNQSILKYINPEYSLEELMLKLKFQYFGHLMGRAKSLEKTLMLVKIEGRKRRWWQRMRGLDSIADSVDMSLSKLWVIVKAKEDWCTAVQGLQRVRQDLETEQHKHKNFFPLFHMFDSLQFWP